MVANPNAVIMKQILLSSFIAATLLTGCSAVYQQGQTPDDLYYAQGRDVDTRQVKNEDAEERYEEYVRTADDRYLRMKVANRNQWSSIDNFSYWNDMRYSFPSNYGYNYGFNHPGFSIINNPWNIGWNNSWGMGSGFNAWNTWGYSNGIYGNRLGWNNPIYTLLAYSNPKVIPATYTSGSNLGAYKNRTYNTSNSLGNEKWSTPSTTGSNNNFGNLVRKIFTAPSSNGSSGNYDRPARTFSSPSNNTPTTSSSAGGSSGGFKSTGSSAKTGRGGRGN